MNRFYALFTAVAVLFSMSAFAAGGQDCSTATAIASFPYFDSGNTTGAVDDYTEVCEYPGVLGQSPDLVYSFPGILGTIGIGSNGFVDIDLCLGTTDYDTKVFVYEGSCPVGPSAPTGTEVGCDDDNDAGCIAPVYMDLWTSQIINMPVTPGMTYYIVVDGYDAGSAGPYTIVVDHAATPPSGMDVAVTSGLFTSLSQRPEYFGDMTFAAGVLNQGSVAATSVSVTANVYSFDDLVTPEFSNTSNVLASLAPNAFDVVSGTAPWTPADTGAYLMEFIMSSSLSPDDTTSNDTTFSFLFVSDSTAAYGLAIFGADVFSFSPGTVNTADIEYAQVHSFPSDVTVSSVEAGIDPEAAGHGMTAVVNVYAVDGVTGDILEPKVGSSAPITLDSAILLQTATFPGGLDLAAGDYAFAQQGDYRFFGTQVGFVDGITSLVRDTAGGLGPSPAADLWWFFGGISNLMWVNATEQGSAACDNSTPPGNLNTALTATKANLSWDAIPNSVAAQIAGTRIVPPGPTGKVNKIGFEPASASVGFPVLGANTTWIWRVRIACQIPPLPVIATGYSVYDTIVVGPAPLKLAGELETTISVFPNPVVNEVFVNVDAATDGSADIRIVDLLGRVYDARNEEVYSGLNTFSFDVTNLEPGVFFISVEQGDATTVEPFSISR